MTKYNLPVDAKNRVTLTKVLKYSDMKISSVSARVLKNGDILIQPNAEVPARELWLYRNQESLASVRRGLSQKGTIDRGSFEEYIEQDDEEDTREQQ